MTAIKHTLCIFSSSEWVIVHLLGLLNEAPAWALDALLIGLCRYPGSPRSLRDQRSMLDDLGLNIPLSGNFFRIACCWTYPCFRYKTLIASPVMTYPATYLLYKTQEVKRVIHSSRADMLKVWIASNCTPYPKVFPPIQFDLLLFQTNVSTGAKP